MAAETVIDCVIFGAPQSGKTSFIRRHVTGEFTLQHLPNSDGHSTIRFRTNLGPVVFHVWENENGAHEDASAILLVDVTDRPAFETLKQTIDLSQVEAGGILVCASKVDFKHRTVFTPEVKTLAGHHGFCDISAKSCYNFEKPFLYLARHKMGEQLHFV